MRFWKALALTLIVAVAAPSIADAKTKKGGKRTAAVSQAAAGEKFRKALDRLDPQTRLEQVCDLEAMNRLKKDPKYKPDRAQGAASAEPKTEGHKLTATGGAFRSKGDWYHLSYNCITGPQHINVRELDYQIGEKVPREKWDKYYLYD